MIVTSSFNNFEQKENDEEANIPPSALYIGSFSCRIVSFAPGFKRPQEDQGAYGLDVINEKLIVQRILLSSLSWVQECVYLGFLVFPFCVAIKRAIYFPSISYSKLTILPGSIAPRLVCANVYGTSATENSF